MGTTRRAVALAAAGTAALALAGGGVALATDGTGSGAADKKQVMKMLALVLRLERPILEDNVADAVAIAVTHSQRSRFAAALVAAGAKA